MGHRILIVDDSKAMSGRVCRTLHQAELRSYDVVETGNGPEALRVIGTVSLELVLRDWNMPDAILDHQAVSGRGCPPRDCARVRMTPSLSLVCGVYQFP
jgi:CheY-like chemotaxis protein